jgi:transcriptional regulator with XRE-family HTH domain
LNVIDLKIEVVRQRRSQYEVARAAGIDPTRLNRILNGWVEPRPEELAAVRAALHLDEVSSGSAQVASAA